MAEPNKTRICRNGHQQTVSNSKFCIFCGTSLVESNTAPNQPNAAPPKFNPPVQGQNQNFQSPSAPPNYQPGNNQPPPQFIQPPPPNYMQSPMPQYVQALECYTCGGNGQGLNEKTIICKECGWLRPLVPDYRVDQKAFEWAADGKAMAALRAITPLNAAAKAVSEKVGRRWIESTFNGVLLGEKQMPQIYGQAVRAARILGMSHMPDVYLSGERSWDCLTFGTDKDSFVVIGSALAGNYQGADMMFLLAREMGHCRAGHALWKTVIRFFLGEQGPAKGFMAGGIFNAILSPTALIGGAIEVPLLAWARQAEITADRAALLVVGEEEIARRVLLSWTLKSSFLFKQINIEAWLEQQATDDGGYSKLSELTTTSTPYIIPRLRLLSDFAKSQELAYWRRMIVGAMQQAAQKNAAPKPAPSAPNAVAPTAENSGAPVAKNPVPQPAKSAAQANVIRLKCAACSAPMRVPVKAMAGKTELPIKCPKCGKITRLRKNVKPAEKASAPKPPKNEENLNYGD